MISDKTIEQFQAAVKTEVVNVAGEPYTTRQVFNAPPPTYTKTPSPATLSFGSLTGLVSYIQDQFDMDLPADLVRESFFVHVESSVLVSLRGPVRGEACQRDVYAQSRYEEVGDFAFGLMHDPETFIIKLQAQFAGTTDRDKVLKVVGNIKDSVVKEFDDDGVTQQVTAKAGIARVAEVAVPNPVFLAPRRTFPEIDQPVSPFILRLKSKEPLPQAALFEADGAEWKNNARQSIKRYLVNALPEVTILA